MSEDTNTNIEDEGASAGASPPPPAAENAKDQKKDQKNPQKKHPPTRVVVRSLTGSSYRRAGIEFDVNTRAFSVSEAQRVIILADARLEVTEE